MSKLHLRVLYPSTAPNKPQDLRVVIECDEYVYSEVGHYRFIKGRRVIAIYPIQYTIIEKIEYV